MRPRAFVVSPFGVKEVRPAREGQPAAAVDFDEIYERILRPALENAGCEAFRGDQEQGAGAIRTDMFFELVTADAVLADISIPSANVFYELGVRHGAAPRGVFIVHAGWSPMVFDVAPDRTFGYDGKLFEPSTPRGPEWEQRVRAEAERLGNRLQAALNVDERGDGSPVYAALPGLRPADWSKVRTARAKYFTGVLDDWNQRVRVARRNGHAEDILTLAEDAPTRFHRGRLLLEAARGLIDLRRFRAARAVLRELHEMEPANFEADCQLGLVLGRLGLAHEAEEHMRRVAALRPGDPQASGILGRVYKDMWRARWETLETLHERQKVAVLHSAMAAFAARSYEAAYRLHLAFYNGINVVALATLLEHLARVTSQAPATMPIPDASEIRVAVRVAAMAALERARAGPAGLDADEMVWAAGTLGELAVVAGDARAAEGHYAAAADVPGISYFQLDSMLSQLEMYGRLGCQEQAVAAARAPLDAAIAYVSVPTRRFRKIVVASGHMIDAPDRPEPRFPPGKEAVVRAHMKNQLEAWDVGERDLAICGGARGADTIFAELCLDRGAHVRLYLVLEEEDFLRRSVGLPGSDWEERHFALLERCEVAHQVERLGKAPEHDSEFGRNNRWLINAALGEADADPNGHATLRLHALLVWDERPGIQDGPGGTSDFAHAVRRLGGRLATINPTRLEA